MFLIRNLLHVTLLRRIIVAVDTAAKSVGGPGGQRPSSGCVSCHKVVTALQMVDRTVR